MNIVIIGASIAGHTVATALREANKACSITLIGRSPYPAYDKRRFLDYLTGSAKEKDLFLVAPDYYQEHGIQFLKECLVTSVGTIRKQVTYKNKDDRRASLDYDFLVVCSGRSTELPDVAGINKEGVYTLDSLVNFKDFRTHLITEPVCIMGSGPGALSVAQALAAKRKEVKLISSGLAVPENPNCYVDTIAADVVELIGEAGIQAVRLSEGKIIGTSLPVFMPEPKKANADFFKNGDIELSDGAIRVNETMSTNVPGVFACGSVCVKPSDANSVKSWEETINESKVLVEHLVRQIGG